MFSVKFSHSFKSAQQVQHVPLNVPLGWSFAVAFFPLALSEDARTLLESQRGFVFFPQPAGRRYGMNTKEKERKWLHRVQENKLKHTWMLFWAF